MQRRLALDDSKLERLFLVIFTDILCQDNTPLWRHRNKFFQVELTGPKRLAATRHVRSEEMTHLISTLPHNCEVNLRAHVGITIINIISRMVLNWRFSARTGERQSGGQRREVENILEVTSSTVSTCICAVYPADFVPALKWLPDFLGLDRRFKKTHRRMEFLATKIISEHEALGKVAPMTEQDKEVLDLLLDEMENAFRDEQPRITMDSIKAITWNAFSGGTDNLTYIQAIAKETMRLHPSSPLLAPHQSINPCGAFGYHIPAQTSLFINFREIGRDARIWTQHLEFLPDRFMDDVAGSNAREKNYNLEQLPFGFGRRMCPGMALALATMRYCSASLLQAFQWSLIAEPDMFEGMGFVAGRVVPLCAIAAPRLSSEFYEWSCAEGC